MAGGVKAKIIASRTLDSDFMARPAIAKTEPSPLPRIDQSFRLAKPRAVFWPRPLKLKPVTVKRPFTVFFSSTRK